jgi:signal transduction histidine kinase
LINPNVALHFVEPEGLPALYSDDKKISQILRNFISNALKFTTQGEVTVRAEPVGSDRILFSVTDTGIGISPENLAVLFQDFVQVKAAAPHSIRGTGLGLALSKKFAELLGGRVFAQSQVGVGSTFAVELPVKLPQSAPSPDSSQVGIES